MVNNIPRLETIKSCSSLTGLSYGFLSSLVKTGRVKHIKAGNRVYINVDSLCELLQKGSSDNEQEE